MKQTSPYIFYKEVAASENLEFADLRKYPCDPQLLSDRLKDEYIKNEAIPWKKTDNGVLIATSSINDNLKVWALENYDGNYHFAITTPFDINYSINTLFAEKKYYRSQG